MIRERSPEVKIGSTAALVQLLGLLGLEGSWLKQETPLTAEMFLQIRGDWERDGLVELDFDGRLHPSPLLARLNWNLIHKRSVMRYESAERVQLLFLGPVDITAAVCTQGVWSLQIYPVTYAEKMALGPWLQDSEAVLTTYPREGEPYVSMCSDSAALAEHLKMFYREEPDNA